MVKSLVEDIHSYESSSLLNLLSTVQTAPPQFLQYLEESLQALIKMTPSSQFAELVVSLLSLGVTFHDSQQMHQRIQNTFRNGSAPQIHALVKGRRPENDEIAWAELRSPLNESDRSLISSRYTTQMIKQVASYYMKLGDQAKVYEYLNLIKDRHDDGIYNQMLLTCHLKFGKITFLDKDTYQTADEVVDSIHAVISKYPSVKYGHEVKDYIRNTVLRELVAKRVSSLILFEIIYLLVPALVPTLKALKLCEYFKVSEDMCFREINHGIVGGSPQNVGILVPVYEQLLKQAVSNGAVLDLLDAISSQAESSPEADYKPLLIPFIVFSEQIEVRDPELSEVLNDKIDRLINIGIVSSDVSADRNIEQSLQYYQGNSKSYLKFLDSLASCPEKQSFLVLSSDLLDRIFGMFAERDYNLVFSKLLKANFKFSSKPQGMDSWFNKLIKNGKDEYLYLFFRGHEMSNRDTSSLVDSLTFDEAKVIISQFPNAYPHTIALNYFLPQKNSQKVEEYLRLEKYIIEWSHSKNITQQLQSYQAALISSSAILGTLFGKLPKSSDLNLEYLVDDLDGIMKSFDLASLPQKTLATIHSANVMRLLQNGVSPKLAVSYLCLYYPSFGETSRRLGFFKFYRLSESDYDCIKPKSEFLVLNKSVPQSRLLTFIYRQMLVESSRITSDVLKELFDNVIRENGANSNAFTSITAYNIAESFMQYAVKFVRITDPALYDYIISRIIKISSNFEGDNKKGLLFGLRDLLEKRSANYFGLSTFLDRSLPLAEPVKLPEDIAQRMVRITPKDKLVELFVRLVRCNIKPINSRDIDQSIYRALKSNNRYQIYCILKGHIPKMDESGRLLLDDSCLTAQEAEAIKKTYPRNVFFHIIINYYMPRKDSSKVDEYLDLLNQNILLHSISEHDKEQGLNVYRELLLSRDLFFGRFFDYKELDEDLKKSQDKQIYELKDLPSIVHGLERNIAEYHIKQYSGWVIFMAHYHNLSGILAYMDPKLRLYYTVLFFPKSWQVYEQLGLTKLLDVSLDDVEKSVKIENRALILPEDDMHIKQLTFLYKDVFMSMGDKISEVQGMELLNRLVAYSKQHKDTELFHPKNFSSIFHRFITFAAIRKYHKLLYRIYFVIEENDYSYDHIDDFRSYVLESLVQEDPKLSVAKLEELKKEHPDLKVHYKTYAMMIKTLAMSEDSSDDAYKVYMFFSQDYPDFRSKGDSLNLLPLIKNFHWKKDTKFAKQFRFSEKKSEVKVKVDKFNVKLYDYDQLGD
ncbi:hypothetical protein FOA43_000972 [Brettanomyces nanus]|uniref:Uncharacterized protein n=1 Tax=Eeniella nana TaxID=13502 RepID=A0A875S1D0_EENNA|nr:uncharacterized protein FOA43_000972 [Brettanomyces nanus]QPG73659.1 hypothetical protein FOA43_000972 [Brettanomyces nanus]